MNALNGLFKSVMIVLVSLCLAYVFFLYSDTLDGWFNIRVTEENFHFCFIVFLITIYTVELINVQMRFAHIRNIVEEVRVINS